MRANLRRDLDNDAKEAKLVSGGEREREWLVDRISQCARLSPFRERERGEGEGRKGSREGRSVRIDSHVCTRYIVHNSYEAYERKRVDGRLNVNESTGYQ